MYREDDCGCGGHGHHHREQDTERQEVSGEDCGCGGHGHYGHHGHNMSREWHHGGCMCGCHQSQRNMGFHRRFVSQEEIVARLEDYLKQLRAEAKGVEERIAELKKGESQQP